MIRYLALLGLLLALGGCSSPNPGTELQPSNNNEESQLQKLARVHTQLAAGYYARNQQNVALEELNEALKVDPKFAPAHNVLGLIYMELKEDAKAEQAFKKAIELAPQDPEIRNNYGWYLCLKGQAKAGIENFNLAARHPLYRTPEVALVNAGQCSARIGEINEAERYFRQALALQPGTIAASYGLADISYKRANFAEAREHMKNVMRAPNPPAAALLIGACVEKKLADRTAELSYIQQLRNRYPDSKELKELLGGWCQ
ncbi:MAG: type IV pilus biogenesis/stability protein PilW [Betaproteobacteria bacterium]|nr:type IV pilus biogenesis/stability protein PilW [Betaproteobacteria bacterium]